MRLLARGYAYKEIARRLNTASGVKPPWRMNGPRRGQQAVARAGKISDGVAASE